MIDDALEGEGNPRRQHHPMQTAKNLFLLLDPVGGCARRWRSRWPCGMDVLWTKAGETMDNLSHPSPE